MFALRKTMHLVRRPLRPSRFLSNEVGENGEADQPYSEAKVYRLAETIQRSWEEDPQFTYACEGKPERRMKLELDNENFRLAELRQLLLEENIRDLVFLRLPGYHMCEYMVIGSGVSRAHIRSAVALIHKALKQKRKSDSSSLPRIEGLDGPCEWIAIDLRNILLNLFMPSVREHYNIEALWVAGPEYDEISQAKFTPPSSQPSQRAIDWDKLIRDVQQKANKPVDTSEEGT